MSEPIDEIHNKDNISDEILNENEIMDEKDNNCHLICQMSDRTKTFDPKTTNNDINECQCFVWIEGYEVLEHKSRYTVFRLRVEDLINDKKWLVFRRYSDFIELNHQLSEHFSKHVFDLPAKRVVKNNFDPIFLERRQLGLQLFLNQILSFKSVVDSESVQQFLAFNKPKVNEKDLLCNCCKQSVIALESLLKSKEHQILSLKQQIHCLKNQILSKDKLFDIDSELNIGIRESPDGRDGTYSLSNSEICDNSSISGV